MRRGTTKIMARLAGSATQVGSHVKGGLGRIGYWLHHLLARGRRLERVSVAEIRVVGARLRREPIPTLSAASSGPQKPVALISSAQQALKQGLKGGAKLKSEM
jgi:hypothetical protein